MRFPWRQDADKKTLRLDYAGETIATVAPAPYRLRRKPCWVAHVVNSPTSARLFHFNTPEDARTKAEEYMVRCGIWPPVQPDLWPR